jgi:hypothetical protein
MRYPAILGLLYLAAVVAGHGGVHYYTIGDAQYNG